jgi:hypothetical protein
VRKLYGTPKYLFGIVDSRTTYIIDKTGKGEEKNKDTSHCFILYCTVIHLYNGVFDANTHVRQVQDVITKLNG